MEEKGELKACQNCGKLVSSTESFCTSCGTNLKLPPQPGQPGAVDPADFKGAGSGPVPPPAYPYPAYTQPYSPPVVGGPQVPGVYPPYQGVQKPYYSTGYLARKTDEMAIVSLICGVASFVIFPLLPAIAAIILGVMSRDRIRKNPGNLEGEGLALTGLILGIVNVVIIAAIFIIFSLIATAAST
jgi:Domain of unknown function (DUF4190)